MARPRRSKTDADWFTPLSYIAHGRKSASAVTINPDPYPTRVIISFTSSSTRSNPLVACLPSPILPIIAEKVHQEKVQQEKLKAVKARLNFEEASQHSESETPIRRRNLKERLGPRRVCSRSGSPEPRRGRSESPRKKEPEKKMVFKRLEKGVFHRLGVKGKSSNGIRFRETWQQKGIFEKNRGIKKCIKDQVEIHNIRQRDGESMEEFVRRYKIECRDVKGAPKCMKIFGFMHGITNPELIKRLHDKIPKSVDEMMRVTTTFLSGEVAASNRERKKSFSSWKQQGAGQKQNFKKGSFQNQQRTERRQDRFTLLTKTPNEILALDKGKFKTPPPMTTPRIARKRITQTFSPKSVISFPSLGEEDGTEGPMIIEAEIGGHCVQRMYVDGGSSSEILYEHCFNRFRPEIKNQMIPAATPLVGFSGEIIWPLGQISLLVKIGDEEHSTSAWMNFMVNSHIVEQQDHPAIVHDGSTLTEEGRRELCGLLRRNLDIFAWKPADMTGVPRHVSEHRLNIREGCLPVRQKKRGKTPKRNKAICEEVEKLVVAGIMKEVHYHS
ncbi:hypothetical protein Tco_0502950 [Tanacetum coccineum]